MKIPQDLLGKDWTECFGRIDGVMPDFNPHHLVALEYSYCLKTLPGIRVYLHQFGRHKKRICERCFNQDNNLENSYKLLGSGHTMYHRGGYEQNLALYCYICRQQIMYNSEAKDCSDCIEFFITNEVGRISRQENIIVRNYF